MKIKKKTVTNVIEVKFFEILGLSPHNNHKWTDVRPWYTGKAGWEPTLNGAALWRKGSGRPEVFSKKGVLKNFANFSGKNLC